MVEIGGGGCFSVCNVGRIEVKSVTLWLRLCCNYIIQEANLKILSDNGKIRYILFSIYPWVRPA